MSTTVNNTPGGTGASGAPVSGTEGLQITAKANLSINGNDAIHQLNERMGNNSQTSSLANTNSTAIQTAHDTNHNAPAAPAADENNGNHNGQLKHGNQGQTPKGNSIPPGQTPPIIELPNQHPSGKGHTVNIPPGQTPPFNPGFPNQGTIPPVQSPPFNPGTSNQGNYPNQFPNNYPQFPPTPNRNPTVVIYNTRTYNPNTPNGVLRNAVVNVLRQNDIYLSRSVINNLTGNPNSNANNRTMNIPTEIRQLVQTVVNQLSNSINNSNPPNRQYIQQLANNISNNLQPQLNSVRNVLVYTDQPDARHFSNLNIQERISLAVELMFNHLPNDTNLNQLSNREIYNGFMLARGLVSSNENGAHIRNLVSYKSDVLPFNFSIAGLRDLGQLVKVLAADASNAKTTANLDLSVQKFIRILIANNELGVLLAASALAKQAELGTLSINRTMALVQIYQLISRLIQAGEAAIKEAAAKNGLIKNEFVGIGLNKAANAEEKNALLRDLQANNLHNSLKNFLEFNPSFVAERSVSSFMNAENARHTRQHFSAHHADEIEQWLNSGNHRFVKEFDLDKPVGIVVERGTEEFFPATKARIVLVRDSSAQGWHFLKSFLVR